MVGLSGLRSFELPSVKPFGVNQNPAQNAECEKLCLLILLCPNKYDEVYVSYLFRISKYQIKEQWYTFTKRSLAKKGKKKK